MTFKLKDAKITHISLVDKGANGVPFAIIKAQKANEGLADQKKPELIAALKALEGGGVLDADSDTP
jgi:hypothetical protein